MLKERKRLKQQENGNGISHYTFGMVFLIHIFVVFAENPIFQNIGFIFLVKEVS